MATPNNLTPTNCSWWPISALESDAARPVEAPDAPEASSPAHWPKESLVLYHWTQSFSSQKVEGAQGADWRLGGDRREGQVARGTVLPGRRAQPQFRSISLGLVPSWGHLNRDKGRGQTSPAGRRPDGAEPRQPHFGPAFSPTRCSRRREPPAHSSQALGSGGGLLQSEARKAGAAMVSALPMSPPTDRGSYGEHPAYVPPSYLH
ncbi:Ganglioside-induced differentiation-associated protein 1-like 1 [Microtus ochrogaster]|uniref:Ganglioside-induced differentiation-associated protein 1-like 1 n=1 Tax=Microtus ochrogaster TaxID=79684 RepID=A0A8J6GJ22_MICOH|nr:Ganglioside-induced differentiation-associated protein 1-like 1 [Microtus ochrogaster]